MILSLKTQYHKIFLNFFLKTNHNLYEILDNSFIHHYLKKCSVYPEWISTTLGELTEKFTTGLNPRKNFILGQGNNYYITIKNMLNNRIILNDSCDKIDDEALLKINRRSDLKVGDLLFSGIGTIGRTYLITIPVNNWNISESIFTLRPSSKISSSFLFLLLTSMNFQNYAINNASGSVQKGIRMSDLKKYQVICPDHQYMKKLNDFWEPLINKVKQNEEENDTLIILRDYLLPKLLSGEIDVSEQFL